MAQRSLVSIQCQRAALPACQGLSGSYGGLTRISPREHHCVRGLWTPEFAKWFQSKLRFLSFLPRAHSSRTAPRATPSRAREAGNLDPARLPGETRRRGAVERQRRRKNLEKWAQRRSSADAARPLVRLRVRPLRAVSGRPPRLGETFRRRSDSGRNHTPHPSAITDSRPSLSQLPTQWLEQRNSVTSHVRLSRNAISFRARRGPAS
jgi:hypothetical protein